jgi:hypothetical protein
MSGETLKVDPQALVGAGTAFGRAGDGLAGLQADVPLGDAAGAVPQLQTADACRKAQSDIAAQTTAVADAARTFGENVHTAAGWYTSRDQAAAQAIQKAEFPSGSTEDDGAEPVAAGATAVSRASASGPNLIYCYEVSGPDPRLCEGYNDDGPYTFPSPIDVSGVG